MEQRLQSYNDGAIFRTGVHSYEVRTSHGTGSGATVAEALKDLADKQVDQSKAKDTSLNIDSEDVKQEPVEKPKKRKSSKKKKQTD